MKKLIFLLFFGFVLVAQNNFNEYGQRDGIWKGYHPNGVMKYEGVFVNGKETGVFKYYNYSASLVIKLNYLDPGVKSKAVIYDNNGVVQSEGEYLHKKKNNLWTYYDNNNNVISQINYLNGVLHGEYTSYYDNGFKSEVSIYENDLKNGVSYLFYRSGNINVECFYVDDRLHGQAKFYYNNNDIVIESIGNYFMGLKDSIWKMYNDLGEINQVIQYDRGVIISKE
tara:strand:+ start:264 stop:938 length:675 start_codon:yes stop_codon:yes gene_type:complete